MKLKLLPLLALCGAAVLGASAATPQRPNILWLVSEDNMPLLGCYGDPVARTPTLDKLAREGVLYERCFTQPVCAPSRFTLITGMYPVTCGPAEHMRAQGKIPAWLKGFPAYLREAGYDTFNNAKTDYNSPINIKEAWTESGKKAHYSHRAAGKPFFSVFNHEVTHESCLFPAKEADTFDAAKMRVRPYQPDTPEVRADWARYYSRIEKLDGLIAERLKELQDAGLAEDTIVFYYSDNGGVLPRTKRFLQQSGTQVPLIVRFPPKWRHLAPAAPGSRIKEPVHFVDFAPTILSLAGVKMPDYMQGRAFAGPAKAKPNEFVFCNRDRMDERYDMMRSANDGRWLYIRNYRPDLPYVQRLDYMFRARGYQSWARLAAEGKLTKTTAMFWGQKPSEELYDMSNDPDSTRNLAQVPEHHKTLERMRTALGNWIIGNKDNGFLPEGSDLEGYEASHANGVFPIERVLALANDASDKNPANLEKFMKALEDTSEPIRWWAAQGCTILGTDAAPAETPLRKSLEDPSGAVQVAAAEALSAIGKPELALPVLKRWIEQKDHPKFALQAGNVLDRMGEKARPALPWIKTALSAAGEQSTKADEYPVRLLSRVVNVLEGREQPLVYP